MNNKFLHFFSNFPFFALLFYRTYLLINTIEHETKIPKNTICIAYMQFDIHTYEQ